MMNRTLLVSSLSFLSFTAAACSSTTPTVSKDSAEARVSATPIDHVSPPPSSTPMEHVVPGEVLEMERTMCYGTCPAYKLTVFEDGRVVYEGRDFVVTKGNAEKNIDAASLEKLRDAFRAAGYLGLGDYTYDAKLDPTDGPSTNLYYAEGGRAHRLGHYAGSHRAPKKLDVLESEIDRILDTDKWIGTPAERNKMTFGH